MLFWMDQLCRLEAQINKDVPEVRIPCLRIPDVPQWLLKGGESPKNIQAGVTCISV